MKFNAYHYFIYITTCADENKQQLKSYYKLTEEDLEEITKEWSADILIPADPAELSDIENPKATHYTPGPRKTKKNEEAQYVSSTLAKTASISPKQGGDGREINGA
jgi:hypothetical protein